jgi:OmcA/MtrC family decaheme c-type cytochrome
MREFLNCLLVGVALAFVFLLNGCGGSSGGDREPSPQLVPQTYDEKCSFCHASGRSEDVAVVHALATKSVSGRIDNVTINLATGMTTVFFKLFDNGAPLALVPAANIRFTLAKLVPPPSPGDSSDWQSYINTIEPGDAQAGTVDEVQATYQRANAQGGVFIDNQDGSYIYQFSFDIRNVTSPVVVPFQPALTHRVAMQVAGNVDNAFFEFVPDGGPLMTRDIARNESCNTCHIKLQFHGGDRISLKYCDTCHNPGTSDARGNTLDLKVFIHKLHDGANLPSVQAGGEYAIWTAPDRSVDFSDVVYPQDIRNCTKCHDGTPGAPNFTVDGNDWKTVPTMQACGSCHDNVDFATGANHQGGIQTNNAGCAGCHPAETGGYQTESYPNGANVTAVHVIPEQVAAKLFKYNIISVTNTAPGQFPTITFSVTNPFNGNAPYNILTDPQFTSSSSSLNVLIGWPTTDYTNTGSTRIPAQPISINARAGAMNNGDGTFTVAPTVPIPKDVTGSGAVAIEGHPAVESVPGSGTYNLRVPVTGAVQSFAITDQTAQNRRAVVDIAKCDQCHGLLSLHGANRNNNTQLCVICHNPDDTDIDRRPSPPAATADGKPEETIDFKYMIHGIHGAQMRPEDPVVIYGFNGQPNNFSDVMMPSGLENLKNCAGCHITAGTTGTFQVPINPNALPTTILTGNNLASPDDNTEITPTASTCSACHNSIAAKTHMTEQGGKFDFVPFAPETPPTGGQDQVALCGPGPISAQPPGHTSNTNCCECHSPK